MGEYAVEQLLNRRALYARTYYLVGGRATNQPRTPGTRRSIMNRP